MPGEAKGKRTSLSGGCAPAPEVAAALVDNLDRALAGDALNLVRETAIGIQREDAKARMNYYMNIYRFFGAPNAIYICMDKGINQHYGPFDIGSITGTICLLAHEKGLGTCILAGSVHYPDVIRKYINIPESKIIVIGIAIGYPDTNNPIYSFKSGRDENIISWDAF